MLLHISLLALAAGCAALTVATPSYAQQTVGYVEEASGNVTARVGTGRSSGLAKGQALAARSTIATGPQSFAALKFEDGTAVLLKENTSFQIQDYAYNPGAPENSRAVFSLTQGGLKLVTGRVTSGNRDALKVATALATIGMRGTEFIAELVNPLYVHVIKGAISVANSAGTVVFMSTHTGVVTNSSTLGSLIPPSQVPPGVLKMPN